MAKEYIERMKVISAIKGYEIENCPEYMQDWVTKLKRAILQDITDDVIKIPAADVVEVKQITVEELKKLPLLAWVWIDVLVPFKCEEKVSAYYRKQENYTHDKAFCCGYPGLSFSFYYKDYGKTWTAYTYQSKERERK